MKKALLLWTLLTPLAIASDDIKDWNVQEHYYNRTVHTYVPGGTHFRLPLPLDCSTYSSAYDNLNRTSITKRLEITPHFTNNFIKKISLNKFTNGDHEIDVITKEMMDCPSDFDKKFNHDPDLDPKYFSTNKIEEFSEFLNFFYQNQYLPNCIIDLIFKKMADQKVFIEDFRLMPVKIISDIN